MAHSLLLLFFDEQKRVSRSLLLFDWHIVYNYHIKQKGSYKELRMLISTIYYYTFLV